MGFRFDRFATLFVARPLCWATSSRKLSVPILMYHSISDDPETGVHPYYRTATLPQVFAAQMKYLHDSGYRTLSLEEATRQLESPTAELGKQVVITFDDGYRNFYSDAFPALRRFAFTATVFLPTAFIGNQALQFKGKTCLTWAEVSELRKHGVAFGSHTVNHPQLWDLSLPAIDSELRISKETIEDKLGCPAVSFAYPYAFPQDDTGFTNKLRDALRNAGYKNGVCTRLGRANRASEPLFLERLPVNSGDDQAFFQAKLLGAYDWIAQPQRLVKMAKRLRRRAAEA